MYRLDYTPAMTHLCKLKRVCGIFTAGIFAVRIFDAGNFRRLQFSPTEISAVGNFRRLEFSSPGIFATRNFRRVEISPQIIFASNWKKIIIFSLLFLGPMPGTPYITPILENGSPSKKVSKIFFRPFEEKNYFSAKICFLDIFF